VLCCCVGHRDFNLCGCVVLCIVTSVFITVLCYAVLCIVTIRVAVLCCVVYDDFSFYSYVVLCIVTFTFHFG